jgi:large subunit ribosomal protein L31
MKADIHPKYVDCKAHCACGNSFMTRSTKPELHVDICNACHPFFTGKQKFVDTAGRVEKFQKKFASGGYFSKPGGTPAGTAAKAPAKA